MSRSAVAILSTPHLLHNVAVIRKAAPHSKLIAMVKANAYGHGLRSVSLRLEGHVDMLGVASIDEALALKKINIQTPILLAEGVFEAHELEIAMREKFHVVFHEKTQLDWLDQTSLKEPIDAWLKIDTGMGRLGFSLEDAKKVYPFLKEHPKVKTLQVMSHFACADTPEHPLNRIQINRFDSFLKATKAKNVSFCNSAALFAFPEWQQDYVRPGIALYGGAPFAEEPALSLGLKPVMTLKTKLISIKHLKRGDTIGYGAHYSCVEDMPIGVVAFGYGDGYPRAAENGTPVLVGGKRCALAGRVSMDMMTVDLRNYPEALVGDEVILWGEGLPVEDVARYTPHISYDLLAGIQNRVRFEWVL